MSELRDQIAGGVAERAVTRIQARDRIDALDAGSEGLTYREQLGADAAALDALAADALAEFLGVLSVKEHRNEIRAIENGSQTPPSAALMTAGLVVASWDGGSFHVSDLGRAAVRSMDALSRDIADRIRAGLGLTR